MVTSYTDLEKEQLSEVDKHEQRRANTLGPDGRLEEEPFGISEIIFREDIFSETPTASTNFASPDYGDYPNGSVATRRIQMRLHPLVTSGKTGNNSIQTFVIVSSAPASDSPVDIESVRIKQLVPADLSIGRTNAADPDPNIRGFELALYPAKNVAGTLAADTSRGIIPNTANPGTAQGLGATGRWTVDYANGIVRFTAAPLNGSDGVMNPNDVYGDINGNYLAAANGGRVTMFATFYQYTGPYLVDPDDVGFVVVGDGVVSFGTFYGTDASGAHNPIMQQAIDSLSPNGGTVFLKEGNYTYQDGAGAYPAYVVVPANVKIYGLSQNAIITRSNLYPAFIMYGANSSIEGITIKCPTATAAADIELATDNSKVLENVKINNNTLYATDTASAIGFAPGYDGSQFLHIFIKENRFTVENTLASPPVFIKKLNGNPVRYYQAPGVGYPGLSEHSMTLQNIHLQANSFNTNDDLSSGTALTLYDVAFGQPTIIEELDIVDSYASASMNIDLRCSIGAPGTPAHRLSFINNSDFGTLTIDGATDSVIDSSHFDTITVGALGLNKVKITNGTMDSGVSVTGQVTDSELIGNNIGSSGLSISGIINSCVMSGNTISGAVSFTNTSNKGIFVNNKLDSTLSFGISNDLGVSGNYISGSVTFTGAATRVNIARNDCGDALIFSSTASSGILSDNIFTGAPFRSLDFGGAVSDYEIFGNAASSNVYFGSTIGTTRFVGNSIGGTFIAIGAISDTNIDENRFSSTVTLNSTLNGSIFSDNDLASTLTFVGALGGTVANQICGNNIVGTTTFSASVDKTTVTGNAFVGNITFSTTVDGSIFADNKISNNLRVVGNFGATTSNTVSGNNVGGYTLFSGTVNKSSFANNTIVGTCTFEGATNDLTISGNYAADDLLFAGAVTRNNLVGNNFEGKTKSINFQSTATNVTIADGYAENIYFGGAVDAASVTGNTLGGSIVFGASATIARSVISSNISYNGNVNVANTISNLVMDGNIFRSILFSGTVNGATFSNNKLNDSFTCSSTIGGTLPNEICSNNISGAVSFASTVGKTKFNDNAIVGVFSTGAVTDSSLSDNNFTGAVTFSSTIDGSIFSDNKLNSTLTFSGAVGGTSANEICANNIVGAVSFSSTLGKTRLTSNTFGNTFGASLAITDSNINGNSFVGAITFSSTFDGSTFTGNKSGSTVVFTGAITNSNINDNNVVGITTISSTLDGSTLSNNVLASNIIFNGVVGLSVPNTMCGNKVAGSVLFANDVYRSVISNNVIDSTLSFGATDDLEISGNSVDDQVLFVGNAARDVLVGNNFKGHLPLKFSATATDVLVADGYIPSIDFSGAALRVSVTGNTTGNVLFGSSATSSVVANNISVGKLTFSGQAQNLAINGNKFTELLMDHASDKDQLIMTSNEFLGSVTISNNAITKSNISGNRITGLLTMPGLTNSIFEDNIVENTINAVALSGVIFDSNRVTNTITITGQVQDTSISNNIGTALNVSDAANSKDRLIISGNNFSGNVTVTGPNTGSGSGMSSSEISNNRVSGNLNLNLPVQDTVIEGNTVGGTFVLSTSNKSLRAVVSGNNITSTSTLYALENCTVGSNTTNNTVLFSESLTETIVSENNFSNYCTITGTVSKATVNNNYMASGTPGTAALTISNAGVKNITVVGNTFDQPGNKAFEVTGGGLQYSTLADNSFFGSISISSINATSLSNNECASAVSITGTISNESVISGNSFGSDFTIGGAITDTVISGNGIGNELTFSSTVDRAVVSNNRISNTTSFDGTVGTSTVSGNNFERGVSFVAVSKSSISENIMSDPSSAALFTSSVADSSIIGNRFDSEIEFSSTIERSAIKGNTISGVVTFTGSWTDVIISGNEISNDIELPSTTVTTSLFDGNHINGNINTVHGAYNYSGFNFSSNIVDGYVYLRHPFTDSNIANNTFSGYMYIEPSSSSGYNYVLSESVFAGNKINGSVVLTYGGMNNTQGALYKSTFSDNEIDGEVTISSTYIQHGGSPVAYSSISCNRFSGKTTIRSVADQYPTIYNSSIDGNVFGALIVHHNRDLAGSGGGAFNIFSFTGNSVSGYVNIYSDTDAYGTFDDGIFTGNVISGSLIFGDSSSPKNTKFTRLNFSHNSGAGHLEFNTTDVVNMPDCVIIGNSMGGNFTIKGMPAGTKYASPPAGQNQPIIALNRFNSYVGISFADDVAIGWGDNIVITASSGNVGSNL